MNVNISVKLTNKMIVKRRILHERIGKGRNALLAARGIGSHRTPVPPTILSKLYWSIAIPRMTYGLKVVHMDDSHIKELSQAHRVHARIVQHLPENVHTPTVLATIGWMSMPAYIAYRKLLFLWSILCLPVNNIYRRIVVAIFVSCDIFGPVKLSPIGDTFNICKYGLKDLFMSCIIRNDGNSK